MGPLYPGVPQLGLVPEWPLGGASLVLEPLSTAEFPKPACTSEETSFEASDPSSQSPLPLLNSALNSLAG